MNGKLNPFRRSRLDLPTKEVFIQQVLESDNFMTPETAEQYYHKMLSDEIWINDEYQVNIDRDPAHGFAPMKIIHLSIKRLDKEPIHDWRDLQQIKNMLVDEQAEAVEVYPAESRLVDSANQYHLWAITELDGKKFPMFPIGWNRRLVKDTSMVGAKQRPR